MKKAFSLSEVLITLGIIGVVAAITLPALITNYQKMQTVTQLKKTYNDILLIHNRAINDYGEPSGWEYPSQYNEAETIRFLEKYYMPYLNNAELLTGYELNYTHNYMIKNTLGGVTTNSSAGIFLSDGRLLAFYPSSSNYTWIAIDINGFKEPNKAGRDVFMLSQFCIHAGACDGVSYMPKFLSGYCNKTTDYRYNGWACGRKIQRDGWKIKSDYPW